MSEFESVLIRAALAFSLIAIARFFVDGERPGPMEAGVCFIVSYALEFT